MKDAFLNPMTLRFAAICVTILTLAGPASAEILIGLAPPLTGPMSWFGQLSKQALELAVADLNAKGGVLGEQLRAILVDDQCDADAAALVAKKLVAEHVAAVFGHGCSGAAIPASEIYEAAGVPMLTEGANSPRFPERGLRYVFRFSGRNDRQAALAADLLSARYGDQPIAIVHDTQAASIVSQEGTASARVEGSARRGIGAGPIGVRRSELRDFVERRRRFSIALVSSNRAASSFARCGSPG
jgi:ABC-type branched-subunit amino acid transport system substrate-binding protein